MLCNQPHVDFRLAADWMHLKLSPAGLPTPLPKRPRFISYYQAVLVVDSTVLRNLARQNVGPL
jgi:hypothetical protein